MQTDVTVVSEKQGMAGMIDRIDDSGAFSIMRASGAMPMGTYAADRLRVAALAFCLEEMTGKEVAGGFRGIYPGWRLRYHAVQPRDRRQVIATLHKPGRSTWVRCRSTRSTRRATGAGTRRNARAVSGGG